MEMQLVLMVEISVRQTSLIHQDKVHFTTFWVQIWPMIFFICFQVLTMLIRLWITHKHSKILMCCNQQN